MTRVEWNGADRFRSGRGTKTNSVIFEIGDHGPGIPSDLASGIFDPFFTTKEPSKGTGLGLDIIAGSLSMDTPWRDIGGVETWRDAFRNASSDHVNPLDGAANTAKPPAHNSVSSALTRCIRLAQSARPRIIVFAFDSRVRQRESGTRARRGLWCP